MAYDPQGGGQYGGQPGMQPGMQGGMQGGGPMGGGGMRGGFGGRRGGPKRRLSTETRRSFETSEFWIYIAVVIGVLVAAASIEGENGDDDYFKADQAWVLVVILTVGYLLSRGWAKSGAREFHWDDPEGRGMVDRMRDTVTGG